MRQPDARATAFAAAAVRLWTRLYTSGLPVDVRHARRAEIASDLWEFVTTRTVMTAGTARSTSCCG